MPFSIVTSLDRPDPAAAALEAMPQGAPPDPAPARVIEVGETAAGIAVPVPEEHGVRFFSASRDFDALDGMIFRSPEQAARAVQAHARLGARRSPRRIAV